MARICVAAIIIAGFFVTGDVAAIIQGGGSAATAAAGLTSQLTTWLTDIHSGGPTPAKASPASPESSFTAARLSDAEQHGLPAVPASTLGSIRIASLKPGDRFQLWCSGQGTQLLEQVTIDCIDPTTGEALLTRRIHAMAKGWQSRRVRINSSVIQNGQRIAVTPISVSPVAVDEYPDASSTEQLGTVVSIRREAR